MSDTGIVLLRKRPYSTSNGDNAAVTGVQQTSKKFLRKTRQGRVLKGNASRDRVVLQVLTFRIVQSFANIIFAQISRAARSSARSVNRSIPLWQKESFDCQKPETTQMIIKGLGTMS